MAGGSRGSPRGNREGGVDNLVVELVAKRLVSTSW